MIGQQHRQQPRDGNLKSHHAESYQEDAGREKQQALLIM